MAQHHQAVLRSGVMEEAEIRDKLHQALHRIRVRASMSTTSPNNGAMSGVPVSMAEANDEQGNSRPLLVLCNHCREPLDVLLSTVSRLGMDALETTSLAETCELVARVRPDIIALNPLALVAGGVELELLEQLQFEEDPIPVLFFVDDLQVLSEARQWRLPLRDFLHKPVQPNEAVHRLELLLLYRRRYRSLLERARYLETQISVDHKTGLLSDRHFDRVLEIEWKRAQRHQNPLALILVDVDDFKAVNDTTEYTFGDEVLRRVGDTLRSTVRETDFAARLGGDEFCLLLPQTTPKEAVQTALRIRQRIAETVVTDGDYSRAVTVSMGIDAYDGRSKTSARDLRSRANQALKDAKKRGKNQVWLFTDRREVAGDAHATVEAEGEA